MPRPATTRGNTGATVRQVGMTYNDVTSFRIRDCRTFRNALPFLYVFLFGSICDGQRPLLSPPDDSIGSLARPLP